MAVSNVLINPLLTYLSNAHSLVFVSASELSTGRLEEEVQKLGYQPLTLLEAELLCKLMKVLKVECESVVVAHEPLPYSEEGVKLYHIYASGVASNVQVSNGAKITTVHTMVMKRP